MHKTFHAYTVRAKQGSAQNSRDNRASGRSKSAGASLRRYNEIKLLQVSIIFVWLIKIKIINTN